LPAPILIEVDVGERDAAGILNNEGLGGLADPQGQGVGQGVFIQREPYSNARFVDETRKSNQLGKLGRDVCHRLFCSAQAAS
jgi:hypothetical protein